jgi:hypothetical protein
MSEVEDIFEELVEDGKIKFGMNLSELKELVLNSKQSLSQKEIIEISDLYRHWRIKRIYNDNKDDFKTFSEVKEAVSNDIINEDDEKYLRKLFDDYKKEFKEEKEEKEGKEKEENTINIDDIKNVFNNSWVKSLYKNSELSIAFDDLLETYGSKDSYSLKDLGLLESLFISYLNILSDDYMKKDIINKNFNEVVEPELKKLFNKKSELKEIFDRLVNDGRINENLLRYFPTSIFEMVEDAYKSELNDKQKVEVKNYMERFLILKLFNNFKYIYEDVDELIRVVNKQNKTLKSKENQNYLKSLFNNYLKTRIKPDQLLSIIKKIPGDYGKLLLHYFDKIIKYEYMANIFTIIRNPNVPFPIALELFNTLNVPSTSPRYSTISDNLSITISDIKKNPEIQWNYNSLSKNPNMTWKFIEETINNIEYKTLDKDKKWDFKYTLSRNPCITFDIVANNLEYKWGIEYLSENPNITLKIVRDNPDLEWDTYMLTKNINIKIKDIIENKDIFKNQNEAILGYTGNPNLNIKDVFEYNKLFKGPNWEGICQNPGISIEDIMETPFFPWPLGEMQYNKNFTYKTIIENDKIFLPFQLSSLIDNKYDGKHKKDVKFPKYWLIVYYLYEYIYNSNKPKEEVYRIAEILFNDMNKTIKNVITTQTIPKEINEKEGIDVGFMKYVINNIINTGYKLNLRWKLEDENIEDFVNAYWNNDGIHLYSTNLKLDKGQCGEDIEYFTQENFNTFDVKQLISFEVEKKVFCLDRDMLIGFWNQEPDSETGYSRAYSLGDCKYDKKGRPYEDTCKKFYKIPIPATYITQKSKDKVVEEEKVNYWKLEKVKNVKIVNGFDNEPIYKVIQKAQYTLE